MVSSPTQLSENLTEMETQQTLEQEQLNINNENESDFHVRKLLYLTLTSGKGLRDVETILKEFDFQLESNTYSYYKIIQELIIPVLDLTVKSCKENLALSNNKKTVGIDGSWNAPKNGRFCLIDLIDCSTKKVIDFQFVSGVDLQINHPNFTFTTDPPNLYEYKGVDAITDRVAFREGTSKFSHDGDVKIKNLIINIKALPIQEVLDFNHKAKSLFYCAASSNSPLNGLYKILRGCFIAAVKNFPPQKRFANFKGMVFHYATGQNAKWKNKDKENSKKALFDKIDECQIILEKLSPEAHTNYNEALHALKAHFAPKNAEFKKTWIIRVCFAILEWNHPTNYETIFRNILQAPPPKSIQSIQYIMSLHQKKLYDQNRRVDPVQKEIVKKRKFQKQPSTFSSPYRHKAVDEELPKDKMKKIGIFPKCNLDLGQNWKNKSFWVKTPTPDRMQ